MSSVTRLGSFIIIMHTYNGYCVWKRNVWVMTTVIKTHKKLCLKQTLRKLNDFGQNCVPKCAAQFNDFCVSS